MIGLKECLQAPDIIVARGPAESVKAWRTSLARALLPNAMVIYLSNTVSVFPEVLAKPEAPDANAWVCRGVNCLPAITTLEALISLCKASQDD